MYRFIPQQVVIFYQNFNKSLPNCSKMYLLCQELDNFWWNLAKFCQMTWKSAANCLYTICLNGNFTMSKVEWVEISEILIISPSRLMTLTRLILVGLLFDLFYRIFDKLYQSVTCNQLQYINNRTYKHGFSTK